MPGSSSFTKNPIERAFVLARSGVYENLRGIERALKAEGFVVAGIEMHLGGQSIRKQIRDAIQEARAASPP